VTVLRDTQVNIKNVTARTVHDDTIDPPRSDAQRRGAAVFLLFRFERGPERVSSR